MVKRIATTPVWDDNAMKRKKELQRRLWRIHLTRKTHVVSAGVLTHLPKRTKICMRISGIGKIEFAQLWMHFICATRDTSTRRTRDVTCDISSELIQAWFMKLGHESAVMHPPHRQMCLNSALWLHSAVSALGKHQQKYLLKSSSRSRLKRQRP